MTNASVQKQAKVVPVPRKKPYEPPMREKEYDSTLGFASRKIGSGMEIHAEQRSTANQILEIFRRGEGPPLLVAGPQEGKTDVMIDVTSQLIESRQEAKKKIVVIWLNNKADNNLRDQTHQRLIKAQLYKEVNLLHLGNIPKFIKDKEKMKEIMEADERLFIIDECHEALAHGKPFDNFMNLFGIKYGKPAKSWNEGKQKNYVLSVSATPYAHLIVNQIEEGVFIPVPLISNDSYYSLKNMNEDGRIHQSQRVVNLKQEKVTSFFEDRLREFLEYSKNKNGYLVIRGTGKIPDIINSYLKEYFPDVHSEEFSDANKNINMLDFKLSNEPVAPEIIIIRGALRAGKTLETIKYIHMWIETGNANGDTAVQVVGRCLGYEKSRHKNKFPFYCNKREIDVALEFYRWIYSSDYKKILFPNGAHSKGNAKHNVQKWKVKVYPTWESIPEQFRSENHRDKTKSVGIQSEGEPYQVDRDRIFSVLRMVPKHSESVKAKKDKGEKSLPRPMFDNGRPTNPEYRDSYEKLCNKYKGEYEEGNRYFVFEPLGEHVHTITEREPLGRNNLKKTSLLHANTA